MNEPEPKEYITLVAGKKNRFYNKCLVQTEMLSFEGSNENYALYSEKTSSKPNVCPEPNEERIANDVPSGTTRFDKVRLHLHQLEVIVDDFAFSKTNGLVNQTFGSAGDCYSSTTGLCPQGRFSINFHGTRFRIKPHTTWETNGKHTSIFFINKLEHPYQKVSATCGGFCGKCFPTKQSNIQLEIY